MLRTSVCLVACACLAAAQGSNGAAGYLLPGNLPDFTRLDANHQCSMDALTSRLAALNTACCSSTSPCDGHPPNTCTIECGEVLVPLMDSCGALLDALGPMDISDGTRDGRSDVLHTLEDACDAMPPADVLHVLGTLEQAGRCPSMLMEGVSTTEVTDDGCRDARTNCDVMITVAMMSCEQDFCPTCALARQCDKQCGFCGEAASQGHRLQASDHPCQPSTFDAQAAAVSTACCDASSNACTGVPDECDARCGVTYVPFYERCADLMRVLMVADMPGFTRLYETCRTQMPTAPMLRLVAQCNTQCEPGSTDDDHDPSTPCVACAPGFHAAAGNVGLCESCPPGRADQDSDPSTACLACPDGTGTPGAYAELGTTECTECSAGFADLDTDPSTRCEHCGHGTYAASGATECTECATGFGDDDSDPSTPCTGQSNGLTCEDIQAQPQDCIQSSFSCLIANDPSRSVGTGGQKVILTGDSYNIVCSNDIQGQLVSGITISSDSGAHATGATQDIIRISPSGLFAARGNYDQSFAATQANIDAICSNWGYTTATGLIQNDVNGSPEAQLANDFESFDQIAGMHDWYSFSCQ